MTSTFQMVVIIITAFIVTAVSGIALIPFLRKLKFGQTILDIGPAWHKNKQGTPTMGGFLFIVGITLSVVVGGGLLGLAGTDLLRLFSVMSMAIAFAVIGFLDDYIKVVKKQNLGLTARQKYLMQLLVGAFYLVMLYLCGDTSTVMIIPFLGQIDLGLFYYVLAIIIITGFVNAVNLTDGIDGLASSVTFVYALIFFVIAGILQKQVPGVISASLAGGCLGFLVWNFHPAKVFMGDTGSLFLGGLVVALAFEVGLPLLIVFAGVIFWCEAFSVILQVISFKSTGKRIFKMSPIHHHFEMSGWSEVKIVTIFSIVAFIGGVLSILSVMML